MEPIVSPWTVYWICQIDQLIGLSVFLTLVAAAGIVGSYAWQYERRDSWRDELRPLCHPNYKGRIRMFLYPAFLLLFAFAAFCPSQKTIVGMMVASKITPDAVKEMVKTGRDFKNEIKGDIIEMIQAIR